MEQSNRIEWILGIVVILLTGLLSTCYSYAANDNESICTVVVDAGHGGYDPGKVAVNDALEKDINLIIAGYLKECLEKENIEVIMTRTTDTDFRDDGSDFKKTKDLKLRCEIMEEANADYCISIHQNSFTDSNVKGAQVFYYSASKEGETLARIIQNSLIEKLDKENTRVAKANDNYYMLVNSHCPTVIVECGFLSNREEAAKLCDSKYQEKTAQAICEGFMEYLKVKENE